MIPLQDCVHGHMYRLDSRNLGIGAFDQESRSFTGIRTKFGDRFLDREFHWDTGEPYGTAKPLEDLGPLPANLRPECYWRTASDGEEVRWICWGIYQTRQTRRNISSRTVKYHSNSDLFTYLQEYERTHLPPD